MPIIPVGIMGISMLLIQPVSLAVWEKDSLPLFLLHPRRLVPVQAPVAVVSPVVEEAAVAVAVGNASGGIEQLTAQMDNQPSAQIYYTPRPKND